MIAHSARFGTYQLGECLGRGGMAAVYKARRRGPGGFEKQVVVKTILPQLARKPQFVRLFKQEAKLSARLSHNNVVQVTDFGVVDETPFLEMEYLSGCNLRQIWELAASQSIRMPASIALAIALEACRGLAYAHSFVDEKGEHRPIIHRDVSPSNVMICRDGTVKLLDFGLASLTRGESLAIDVFYGKLAYLSPEQLERRRVDRRADVFALGAVLHEMLTGRRLFAGTDDGDTLQRVLKMPIDPPSAIDRSVPSAVDVVVLRALQRDPDLRPQSAVELLAALEGLKELTASRGELLRWLGQVAPSLFTVTCENCGRRLPVGVECSGCMTMPEGPQMMSVAAAELEQGTSPPPSRQPSMSWLRRSWLRATRGVALWWRGVEVRRAERALVLAEQRLRDAMA
jgi:serine/threonine-protein kinase